MSVWPAWEVREDGGATAWFQVRLAFPDSAGVEVLAVLADGNVSLEDVRARPAISLDDLTELADWIEGPLCEACGIATETVEAPARARSRAGPGRRGRAASRGGGWWRRSTGPHSRKAPTRCSR
ncbi:hypothetical protein SGLAM104S_00983 [Streptomyces glaucescens]